MENYQKTDYSSESDNVSNSDYSNDYNEKYSLHNQNFNILHHHQKYFGIKEYIYNLQNKSLNYNMMSLYKDKYKFYAENYNIEITNKLFHQFINNNNENFIIDNNASINFIDFTKFKVIDIFMFKGIKYPAIDITIYLTNDMEHTLDIHYSVIDNNDEFRKTYITIEYDMINVSEYYNFEQYIDDVLDSIEII